MKQNLIKLTGAVLILSAVIVLGSKFSTGKIGLLDDGAKKNQIAQVGSPVVLPPGIVGWWSLDEGSGTKAGDSSGNGNDGTLTNGPSWVTGHAGGFAVNYDGNNDYITVPDPGVGVPGRGILDFGTDNFSYGLWYKLRPGGGGNSNGYETLITKGGTGSGTDGYDIEYNISQQKIYGRLSDGNSRVSVGSNSAFERRDGAWHHVFVVVNRTTGQLILYEDGVAQIPVSIPGSWGSVTNSQALQFGRSSKMVDGALDDVRVYNRALTSTEITGLYSGADTTNPTVSLAMPAEGERVSGSSVTLNANASDNIGVAGVQFKVDGVSFQSENMSSPYEVIWDTTTVADGAHSLSAVARDAAGNITTSPAVNVTVNNQFDFSLSSSGSTVTTRPTGVSTRQIAIAVVSGTPAPVTIFVSNLPVGVTSTFTTANTCTPACNVTVRLQLSASSVAGTYNNITVTGTSGSVVRTIPLTLTINDPGLIVACSPTPSSVQTGQSVTWTSSVSGGSDSYTYAWSGTDSLSGTSANVSKTYPTAGTKTASLTVTSGALTSTVACSNSVTVTVPPSTVTLSTNQVSVPVGSAATLTWVGTRVSSCSVYALPLNTNWNGAKTTSGSQSTGSLTTTTQFYIHCIGLDGTSPTANATVTTTTTYPTVAIYASPTSIAYGASAALTWKSTNSTTCLATSIPVNSNWNGTKPTSGTSVSTGPLSVTTQFSLQCSGPSGVTSFVSATVSVPLTAVSLFATPNPAISGSAPALTWAATNAYSCTASAAPANSLWTGSKPMNGANVATSPITAPTDFYITCTGLDGTIRTTSTRVNISTKPSQPVAPIVVTNAYCGGYINVSWSATLGALTYKLFRAVSPFTTFTQVYSGSALQYYFDRGTPSTLYSYYVIASNSAGDSLPSLRTTGATSVACPPVPTVSLTASPTSIAYGASSALSWTSTNATACTASSIPANPNWTGSKPTSGTNVSTGPLTASTQFQIYCSGLGGGSTIVKAAVTVVAPAVPSRPNPPVVTVPAGCSSAGRLNLTWSPVAGATQYKLFRAELPSTLYSEVFLYDTLTHSDNNLNPSTQYSYYLVASNSVGDSLSSTSVSGISSAACTDAVSVELSATPTSVTSGASSALSWASVNATACTASSVPANPNWTGSKPTSGKNVSTGPLTASTQFQIYCSGAAGRSWSWYQTVNVTNAVPARPSAPRVVNPGSARCGGYIDLYWEDAPGATYYKVYRDNVLVNILSLFFSDTNYSDRVPVNTFHSYQLVASNSVGDSSPSLIAANTAGAISSQSCTP